MQGQLGARMEEDDVPPCAQQGEYFGVHAVNRCNVCDRVVGARRSGMTPCVHIGCRTLMRIDGDDHCDCPLAPAGPVPMPGAVLDEPSQGMQMQTEGGQLAML